ncbi:hypothetical protein VTJ04DRAFT_5664 [Mycothermus thermophilus]|uniref:uncharacterized protein n=1 Tax=Humicola insolens TaxID=85995 RepID=UPI0037421D30
MGESRSGSASERRASDDSPDRVVFQAGLSGNNPWARDGWHRFPYSACASSRWSVTANRAVRQLIRDATRTVTETTGNGQAFGTYSPEEAGRNKMLVRIDDQNKIAKQSRYCGMQTRSPQQENSPVAIEV